ncbi:hypothetical protein PspLS_02212 [Pyricularia sp. CBS 133598]|nr:hypothetical protein PspLS_02212 [Pyricularia sp. CBS 133598]
MYPKYLLLTLVAGVVAVPVPAQEGSGESSGALQARTVDDSPVKPPPRPTFPNPADDDSSVDRPRGGRVTSPHAKVPRGFPDSGTSQPPRPTFPNPDKDDDSPKRSRGGRMTSSHVKAPGGARKCGSQGRRVHKRGGYDSDGSCSDDDERYKALRAQSSYQSLSELIGQRKDNKSQKGSGSNSGSTQDKDKDKDKDKRSI